MEMIMNVFEWLHTFLISSGIAEGIDNFVREFFRAMGDMGEIIVLSTFFIILFIRIFKFLLVMMVVFALIKFGILIL